MPCVQPSAVNANNFLRWHPCADVTFPFTGPLDYCQPPRLPCAVALDAQLGQPFPRPLAAVAGDVLQFYINSLDGIDISKGFASVALGLAQDGQLVTPNAGTLSSLPDPRNANYYFLYGTLQIDCESDGTYWPVIYDRDDLHVLLIANPVEISNWQQWQRDTVLVEFSHPSALYGVNYPALDGFVQRFRLDASLFRPTFPATEDVYTNRNNSTRRTKYQTDCIWTFQSGFWDVQAYQAAAAMAAHDYLVISGVQGRVQGGLESKYVDGGDESGWVTVSGKIQDKDFARTVLSC